MWYEVLSSQKWGTAEVSNHPEERLILFDFWVVFCFYMIVFNITHAQVAFKDSPIFRAPAWDLDSIPWSAIDPLCDLRQDPYSVCASVPDLGNRDNNTPQPHRDALRINTFKIVKCLKIYGCRVMYKKWVLYQSNIALECMHITLMIGNKLPLTSLPLRESLAAYNREEAHEFA